MRKKSKPEHICVGSLKLKGERGSKGKGKLFKVFRFLSTLYVPPFTSVPLGHLRI